MSNISISIFNSFIKKFGIIDLYADYSGSGDEGYINELKFTSSRQRTPSRDVVMEELYNTLYDVSDWVNNEGGGGELVIEAGKVKLWHQYGYETSHFDIINFKAD